MKLCGMETGVRLGAEIVGLPKVVEIHEDESRAADLGAGLRFSSPGFPARPRPTCPIRPGPATMPRGLSIIPGAWPWLQPMSASSAPTCCSATFPPLDRNGFPDSHAPEDKKLPTLPARGLSDNQAAATSLGSRGSRHYAPAPPPRQAVGFWQPPPMPVVERSSRAALKAQACRRIREIVSSDR